MSNTVTSSQNDVREEVRERYGKVATRPSGGCCGGSGGGVEVEVSKNIGYTDQELGSIPAEANLGVGCGNPTATAEIRPGDTVVDLGSGAGMDCFLASAAAGPNGRVIGVDMTDEMLDRARRNAANGGYSNVEFRKGYIEELPIESGTVDVVLSNCVINLSPDKAKVFEETHRVLKPGGRLMVSDIVVTKPLPDAVRKSIEAYVGCIAGAMQIDEYLDVVRQAGFDEVEEVSRSNFGDSILGDEQTLNHFAAEFGVSEDIVRQTASSVLSLKVKATRK